MFGVDAAQEKTTTIFSIPNAHGLGGVRDVQYNPNKPYYLMTAGDDGMINFTLRIRLYILSNKSEVHSTEI